MTFWIYKFILQKYEYPRIKRPVRFRWLMLLCFFCSDILNCFDLGQKTLYFGSKSDNVFYLSLSNDMAWALNCKELVFDVFCKEVWNCLS